jgi:hypothetical protein
MIENMKEKREEIASGLLYILKDKDMMYILDCILESPPKHSANIDNLSRRSGVEEPELNQCMRKLESLNVIQINEDEYTINDNSIILQELHSLNSAINAKQS